MRVMHVLDSLDHGGAEAVVVDLANAAAAEHEVTICCLRRVGALTERLDPAVHVICLGRPEGNDFTLPWRIARVARQLDVEVVHSHSWGVFLEATLAATLARARSVHTVHGPYLQHGNSGNQRCRAWLRRRLEHLAARKVEVIACVSTSLAEQVRNEMELPARVVTVHNGIPEVAVPGEKADLLDRGAEARLVSVGRMAPVKAYEVLLRAFATTLQRMPRLRLTLIGMAPRDSDSRDWRSDSVFGRASISSASGTTSMRC
ncbi:MAG: glycosyltransferase [Acidobacteria bacterium]|nr:glycosyltransferase [Acidobacteriota bacterium]